MKYFKGPQKYMFSSNDESYPKHLINDIKGLWYLPEKIKKSDLLGKTIFHISKWNGSRFIGAVTNIKSNGKYVELTFKKTAWENDTTYLELDEIMSIRA